MSWRATAVVKGLKTNITRSEKFLLLILADYHNDETGQCNPSVRRLADDALMSTRRAQQLLSSLEDKGLIAIEGREGGRETSQYWLTCVGDTPEKFSGVTPETGFAPPPKRVSPHPRNSPRPTPETGFAPPPKRVSPEPQEEPQGREPSDEPPPEPPARAALRVGVAEERKRVRELYASTIAISISPLIAPDLDKLVELYPLDAVEEAFEEAAKRGARSLRYVERILERWALEGRPRRVDRRQSAEPDSIRSRVLARWNALVAGTGGD